MVDSYLCIIARQTGLGLEKNCIISSRKYRHIGRLDNGGELVSLASNDVSRDMLIQLILPFVVMSIFTGSRTSFPTKIEGSWSFWMMIRSAQSVICEKVAGVTSPHAGGS